MDFLNLAIAFALVPLVQGSVQIFKGDNWSKWVTRVFTLLVAMVLVYLVRMAGIPEVSAQLANLYFAALTAIGAALIAMGLYSQQKNDITAKIAKSESNVTVPSELVDVKAGEPGTTSTVPTAPVSNMPSMNQFPPVVDPTLPQPEPEEDL